LHFNKPTQTTYKNGALNLDLNKLMQNVGAEMFDYGTFKAAYDTDARIKTMVKNFNKDGIEPKTQNSIDSEPETSVDSGQDTVGQMAKRATDLGDL
jgi:hypothetical protein